MGNLRDIRRRSKSVKNTSQITRAMQMVASAKMPVSYTHLDVYKRQALGEAWQKVSDAAKTIVTLASQGKMTELPSPKSSVEGDRCV